MIVDQHQPVVEKYYGHGKMSSVIERLLEECDRIVKDVIEAWEEERSMKRKVRLMQYYPDGNQLDASGSSWISPAQVPHSTLQCSIESRHLNLMQLAGILLTLGRLTKFFQNWLELLVDGVYF